MNKKVLKDWHPSFAELSLHKESAVVIYSFERVREREVPSQCNLFSSPFLQKAQPSIVERASTAYWRDRDVNG